jgi:transcriptional regulator with XRE-family HTH domain
MKTDFASILSSLRRDSGQSQKKAADNLGISQALLSHYENGIREPKLEFILKACDYYDVTADYMLGRTRAKNTDMLVLDVQTSRERQVRDAAMLISAMLMDIDDPAVREAVSRYMIHSLYVVLSALRSPSRPYEPLLDAAIKAAEANLVENARRAWEKGDVPGKVANDTLRKRYPGLYETLLEIDGIMADTVAGISQMSKANHQRDDL